MSKKFDLKRNLYEMANWIGTSGPHRCPETGSAVLRANYLHIFKVSFLCNVAGLTGYNLCWYIFKHDKSPLSKPIDAKTPPSLGNSFRSPFQYHRRKPHPTLEPEEYLKFDNKEVLFFYDLLH